MLISFPYACGPGRYHGKEPRCCACREQDSRSSALRALVIRCVIDPSWNSVNAFSHLDPWTVYFLQVLDMSVEL